jgi:RNase adaptor protein for sRNA GlmZ degradation
MAAGTGRGINDPVNLPLLLVLAKIESAAAETRGLTVVFIDGGDERLKQRYMENRWLHPSCRRLSDHG